MNPDHRKQLVKERLRIANKLLGIKDQFRNPDEVQVIGSEWTHPYRHFEGLLNYLALTCFDILGQPEEWVDFGNWLKFSDTKIERERVFASCSDCEFEERIKSIYTGYNELYGVKNSFYRFINEIMLDENRQELLRSITVSRITHEPQILPDGSHKPRAGVKDEISDEKKKKFLFALRNDFTHKGIPYGDSSGGVFDIYDKPINLGGKMVRLTKKNIFVEKPRHDQPYYSYTVDNWPSLLLNIIDREITR